MSKVRVAVYGTTGKSISFDPNATDGAQIGKNLLLPDGTVATLANLAALLDAAAPSTPVGSTGAIAHSTLAGLTTGDDHPQYLRKDTLTTEGDIYVRGASTVDRLAIGASGTVLSSDGTDVSWQPLFPLFGNPTADIGLTAVNGTAITAMRSDGAPALDQGIVPTWTGQHTFNLTPLVGSTKVVLESRQVIAGSGLTGGGALTGDVTLTLDHSVFAAVAFSGAYSDLSGTPTIPADIHTATFLTTAAEAGLPNSRRELAGTNVTFDDSVTGQRTINVAGGGTGSVTSVSITAPAAGITQSGSPITVSGSITLALANDLAALEGLGSTGIAVRSATDTWVQRSIDGTSGRIAVSNGSGVAGDPTVDIDSAYVGQATITTLGTIATGVWNGTKIDLANYATGILPATSFPTLTGDVTTAGGALATTIAASAVTLAKMANLAASSIIGNNTGSPATPLALTVAQTKTLLAYAFSDLTGSVAASQMPALTGDVTTSAGAVATTISAAAVTLAKMANLAANSIIGNNTGSPATPIALTVAQLKTLLALASTDLSDVVSGSYTGTLTGMTTSPTTTVFYSKVGRLVTITIVAQTGTSNAHTFSITGALPASCQPTTTKWISIALLEDAGSANLQGSIAEMGAGSSTILFGFGGSSTAFTNSGTKGISSNLSFTYSID